MNYEIHDKPILKTKNIIVNKSFDFAVEIVKIVKVIQNVHKEYILTKQLMRSGTSIGANVREAHNAESKKDFIHKMSIAQKECDETKYWLEIMKEAEYINKVDFTLLYNQASELLKILRSIIMTTKQNLKIS